tara:strand:+ start:6253 stop:6993 length:741 start_codon:yes stop_codon:yes gene_type:complete
MKIPKRSEMTASITAGKKAKKAGHEFEHKLAALFDQLFGGEHKVDGRPQTKVDMYEETSKRKYSIKSISKNHTQVALLSTEKFIKHFKIKGHSETFLRMFFGYPNPELKSIVQERHPDLNLSEKEIHQNRVYKNNIEKKVCSSFVTWMNKNKCSIFDVIVRRGFEGDAVDTIIWHTKGSDLLRMVAVNMMEKQVEKGRWTLNNTTLEFRLEDGRKLFHLQMKGSGKKYNSGYHGLMFHIYNINYNK